MAKTRNRARNAVAAGGAEAKARMAFREAAVEVVRAEGEGAEETVRLSVSSETPYFREVMWDEKSGEWLRGWEVLGHADGEIDFSRMKDGLVIQDTHWGDQIGLMREPKVENGKLCGEVEFCCGERAREIRDDALRGLRRNMSVGYRVAEYERVGEAEDGEPVYRAVKWTPHEASFVNCPADTEVGVGRSLAVPGETAAEPAAVQQKGIQIMDAEIKAGLTAENVVECFRLARAADVEHAEVDALIKGGKTFEEVRAELEAKVEARVRELAARKPEMPAPERRAAFADEAEKAKVRRRYSLSNVIRALAGDGVDIGFERECSAEIEAKTGRKAQGILVPDFVRADNVAGAFGTPDYTNATAAGGSGHNAIATDLLSGQFIDALRDALVLTGAGMQTLSGLVGDVAIPKGGTVTAAWIAAENGDATKTNPTLGQASATPHSCGAYVDITRKLLLQSSIDVQGFVTKELVYALAHALEDAAFNGGGANGVPAGVFGKIANTVAFTAGAPTKAKILEMVTKIDEANGNLGTMRFIGRPSVWSLLGGTLDWTAVTSDSKNVGGVTSGKYLLDTATSKVEGYDFVKSNICPAKSLVFGDWSQLTMCLWSGTDVMVDPYSNSTKGALRVVALQDADFIVRQASAFCKGTTLLA